MTIVNKKEFCQMVDECIKPKRLPEVIHTNKFRQLLISLDRIIVLFFSKQTKEKKIQILSTVHSECFQEGYQFQEHSVTLKQSERNSEVTQM